MLVIGVGEKASAHQPNLHCIEIAGRDDVALRIRRLPWRMSEALRLRASSIKICAQRQNTHCARSLDSRQRVHGIQQLAKEPPWLSCVLRIFRSRQGDVHSKKVVRAESWINRAQLA